MKTAVINFKVDPKIKAMAQKRANELGVTLSMVMNNHLREFAGAKAVPFEFPTEKMTPHMEKLIAKSEASGTVGPFTPDEFIAHIKNFPPNEDRIH